MRYDLIVVKVRIWHVVVAAVAILAIVGLLSLTVGGSFFFTHVAKR